ncbi:MAG TPA: non-canonical purine NTP pyrophosphatase [Pyrinomonadaceae bacterium]|jgi:XTP/dITP diphosphohydrolase|nr:non-canonical purine NTP pyrophosphatase [Pyrinomonadaceae bacterium]
MTPRFEILVATQNPGKIHEVDEALQSLPVTLRHLNEFRVVTVDEVGKTYEENAALKAMGYASQTRLCALADDSGLEVDALDGEPGVLSARYAGELATDGDRISKLLSTLAKQKDRGRNARFVCCMALAGWELRDGLRDARIDAEQPQLLTVVQASCEGTITFQARGTNGFGFDPIFQPAGYAQTFAELSSEVKASISHRAQALIGIRKFLDSWLSQLDRSGVRP